VGGTEMTYQITKQIRIHHEDGWFYQFTDDGGDGCIEIEYYEMVGNTETKEGSSFSIEKKGIETFIRVLEQLK
jgi:hypothetical protein